LLGVMYLFVRGLILPLSTIFLLGLVPTEVFYCGFFFYVRSIFVLVKSNMYFLN
jgi:hypothetical protein